MIEIVDDSKVIELEGLGEGPPCVRIVVVPLKRTYSEENENKVEDNEPSEQGVKAEHLASNDAA